MMKFFLLLYLVCIPAFLYSSDTIYFTSGNSTIKVDVGDKVDYACDIADGGKIFVCPDDIDNYYFLTFTIGSQKVTNADYLVKLPDTNSRSQYETSYGMSGFYTFQKIRNGITYKATVEVIWVYCQKEETLISGVDSIMSFNESIEYSVNDLNSERYEWYLVPAEAGTLTNKGKTSELLTNKEFEGEVYLYALGINGRSINDKDTLSSKKIFIKSTITSATYIEKSQIQFYPNPVSNYLNVDFEGAFGYKIYSTDGIIAANGKNTNGLIPVSDLQPGLYWLQIQSDDNVMVTQPFIKQ